MLNSTLRTRVFLFVEWFSVNGFLRISIGVLHISQNITMVPDHIYVVIGAICSKQQTLHVHCILFRVTINSDLSM